ncbi:MAG TPA: hypothetical protein VJB70_00980 [Candidatus Paceibacterota bacterium]
MATKKQYASQTEDSVTISANIEEPHFPIIIFGFATVKDFVIDPLVLAIELTGVLAIFGWVFGVFVQILFSFVLFLWVFLKTDAVSRRLIRKVALRIALAIMISLVPGASIVPETMVIVALTHFQEKKIVKKLLGVAEKIE